MKRSKTLLWLSILCVVAVGARAQSAATKDTKSFLWQVKSGEAVVYLLGSVHAAEANVFPLPQAIEKAFQSSQVLVVEANVLDQNQDAAMQMMMAAAYPPGDSLDKHVPRELYDRTAARLEQLRLPVAQYKQFKPWFIGLTITMSELARHGVRPENGVDVHFLRRAKGKLKIVELDGADGQLKLLNGFSDKEQELFLRYSHEGLDTMAQDLTAMMNAWKTGDAKRIEELIQQTAAEDPAVKPILKKLFDDRNRVMAAKIESFLKSAQTHFVVVGAGHLVGENGLVKLLGAKNAVAQM